MDVFFGLLLPKILNTFDLKCEPKDIVPEFPLRKGSLYPLISNESYKVDFAAFCQGTFGKHLVLVELKTDPNSISKKQLKHMTTARNKGVQKVLRGVLECSCHSKKLRKYAHLIQILCHQVCCIERPATFTDYISATSATELKNHFKALRDYKNLDDIGCAGWSNAEIKLLLIYPGNESSKFSPKFNECMEDWLLVDFNKVAKIVDNKTLSDFLIDIAETTADTASLEPKPLGE